MKIFSKIWNGSSYWHRNSAIIARTHDKNIGKDVLIYKVVGHHDSGKYGPYDNEYICEEITVDGEFVDGFRVFMSNESNLMLPEDATLSNDPSTEVNPNEYEKLVLIRLKKNPNYYITNTNNEHKWLLEAYKCNSTKIDLGDFTRVDSVNYDYEDDLWKKISDTYDADGSLTPSELIDSLCNLMTENTYVFTDDGSPLFTKKYTLQVDENTETNVGWSVASFSPILNNEICNAVGVGEWYMDDQDDQTMIEEKLEYFVNDAICLYFPFLYSSVVMVIFLPNSFTTTTLPCIVPFFPLRSGIIFSFDFSNNLEFLWTSLLFIILNARAILLLRYV